MRKLTCGLVSVALGGGLVYAATAPAAAAPPSGTATTEAPQATPFVDDLPNPLEDKRRALREAALTGVLDGELQPEVIDGSTVVKVGAEAAPEGTAPAKAEGGPNATQDQYVELSHESTDKIFVILAEFGDQRHPDFPDVDSDPTTPGPTRFDGPRHNEIPEPDRSVDNTTVWQPDYDQQHYQDLYFGDGDATLKSYYEAQSSGRYSVDGEVSDWVRVPYNEARYGRTDAGAWYLVRDAVNQWVAEREAAGMSDEDIAAELAEFDQQDRYDYDGDGDFNEPDGYIDHFQIVHAGGDESDGDPTYGEDAIWAHRWYAFGTDQGVTGPETNRLGGTQIGDTGIWVGDYTVQPENGGYSVFAHEFAHDLGLPDDYDTTNKASNNVEYWSLMAQSRLGAEGEPLGSRAGDLGAWEKLQLGWLDYEVVPAGQKRTIDLGPQEYNSAKAQAIVSVLPDKEVTTQFGAPFAGEKQWWSGRADNLSSTMTATADLRRATTAQATLKARWGIEADYDYLYFQASTDGGKNWTSLQGTVDGTAFDTDSSGAPSLSGMHPEWGDVVVPLDAYAGQRVQLRMLYRTDGGYTEAGFFADDIAITANGRTVFSNGAESVPSVLALDGFTAVGASQTKGYDNYYIAGHRSYVSYDQYLRTGPYNFGFGSALPDFVEHFPYQEGLLVTYWDTSMADNNVSDHYGEGRNLIVDAHPRPIYNLQGNPWRTRIQSYDAPFGTQPVDSFTLHVDGQPSYIRGQKPARVFDDTKKFFFEEFPSQGVKLPGVGVKMRVVSEDGTSMRVRVS
ncbi:immune inhibitor A domain-containing protein [uncultured Pseudokineococcus sp.]|uniref:immune inhibitor A domain-containing protein n=1 Tax=uncultured Pseudokineococcus sp. TaxID=1642928 RepID=UPI00261E86E1|nr:immune inhibitor A domain-containing protein [uncultured Pseudokineococcus sp.]